MDEFEDILYTWKEDCGGKIAADSRTRTILLCNLMVALKAKGCKKEDITGSKIKKIVDMCVPAKYRDKQALQDWRKATEDNIKTARARIFREELPRATAEDVAPKQVDFSELEKAFGFDEAAQTTKEEPKKEYERLGEELDRSVFKGVPLPDTVIDEDFLKELGVEPNE